jgi:hypothetical protein
MAFSSTLLSSLVLSHVIQHVCMPPNQHNHFCCNSVNKCWIPASLNILPHPYVPLHKDICIGGSLKYAS